MTTFSDEHYDQSKAAGDALLDAHLNAARLTIARAGSPRQGYCDVAAYLYKVAPEQMIQTLLLAATMRLVDQDGGRASNGAAS